jgi:hypothetical protein
MTPNCSPSGAMTRRGLMRICRFTRVRGVLLVLLLPLPLLLLLLSIAR